MREVDLHNRGNQADYVLGTVEGWGAFNVVRWHAVEEISRPFEYDITLLRDPSRGPADLDRLLDSGATFRIATAGRWRSVHGIIAEAEEMDRTRTMIVYRLLFVPPIWRARFRRRCRTFVGKSLAEIAVEVLENRAPRHRSGLRGLEHMAGNLVLPDPNPSFETFVEPQGQYRFSLGERRRFEEPRAQVVQYNESDFDFLSRLLEEEGLSYLFEHTQTAVVFTITDRPGWEAMFEKDRTFAMQGIARAGASRDQEVIRTLRPARRMRSRGVTMRDYAWRKSRLALEATVSAAPELKDEFVHFEFPARDEDEPKAPGLSPAQVRMDRFETERALTEGSSTVRTMEPGFRFKLHDQDSLLDDTELLVVRVETFATELLPEGTVLDREPFGFAGSPPADQARYENRFQVIPAHMTFRPARQTPKPRIDGVETARVTAEEVTGTAGDDKQALNSDEFGRVRVRFPWDQRENDGTPTSKWVRVAQHWAGAGYGAFYVPRVGHEVLVAYERGDPDRPLILGRVYNQQNQPPYMEANATVSTVKSASATNVQASVEDGFNEFRFDDKLGAEEIYLHAQKNLTEVVLANHSTSVGGDQSSSVGGNQSNVVTANQSNKVEGDRFHTIVGREVVYVGGDHRTHYGSNEVYGVAGKRESIVGGSDKLDVGGDRETNVGGLHVVATKDNHVLHAANFLFYPGTNFDVQSPAARFSQEVMFRANVGGCELCLTPGIATLTNGAGASITMVGGLVTIDAATVIIKSEGYLHVNAGGSMDLSSSGDINATAATIKLNG